LHAAQWESAVARLERAELTRRRTGRDPVKRFCCTRQRVETIPMLQVGWAVGAASVCCFRPGREEGAAAKAPL
jgi:hypothetical protein